MKYKLLKIKIYFIAKEFFQYSLVAYLILLLIETIKEGFVSFFFNLNILLGIVLISGLIMAITYQKELEKLTKTKKIKQRKWWDILYSIMLALGGALVVLYKTQDFGIVSIIVSVISAFIIVLLSFLVLLDKE